MFLWREAAGRSPLKGELRSKTCWWMGLVVLECEENNVTENKGWSKEGRGGTDKPGKDVSGADAQTVLLRGMPWRNMRRNRMMLGWMKE